MRSLSLRVLFWSLVPGILPLVCILLGLAMLRQRPFPAPLSDLRQRMAAVVAVGLGLSCLNGLMIWVGRSSLRAGRFLDPPVVPLGLVPRSYALFQGRYGGGVHGREAAVESLPGRGVAPAGVDIHVSPYLDLTAAIAARRPLLACSDGSRLQIDASERTGPSV